MMTFTSLRLYDPLSKTSVIFPIFGANTSSPFILKNVDGLGPTTSDLQIMPTTERDDFYQGSRPQAREIVMTIGLNPNYAVGETSSSLRKILYSVLSPSMEGNALQLQFFNGNAGVAFVNGWIKTIEPSVFTKDPIVQLAIGTVSPYFSGWDGVYTYYEGNTKNWVVENIGTATVGFIFELEILKALTIGWSIYPQELGISMAFNLKTDGLAVGDKLTVYTEPGSKSVTWVKAGTTTKLQGARWLSAKTQWTSIRPGINNLQSAINPEYYKLSYIWYRPQYLGV